MVVVHVEPSHSRRKRLNRRKNYRKKQRNFSAGELKIKYNNENNLIFLFGGLLLQIKNSFWSVGNRLFFNL